MFEVKKSPIHGNGIFATQNIPTGTSLFQTHRLNIGNLVRGKWINIKPNCMYNHSINANCKSVTTSRHKLLVSIGDIKRGEEFLVDFTKDKDLEQPQEGWSE
jgi:hypothetical protein